MAFELRAPAALPFRDWAPVALPFRDWAPAALPSRDWAPAALPFRDWALVALPFRDWAPVALPFRDWAPVALPFKDWASAALPFRDWALAALCGHYATMIFSLSNVLNYSLASYLPGPGTSWSDICNLCSTFKIHSSHFARIKQLRAVVLCTRDYRRF